MNELINKISSKVDKKIIMIILLICILIFYLIYNKENLDVNMYTFNLGIDDAQKNISFNTSPDASKVLLTYGSIQDNTTISITDNMIYVSNKLNQLRTLELDTNGAPSNGRWNPTWGGIVSTSANRTKIMAIGSDYNFYLAHINSSGNIASQWTYVSASAVLKIVTFDDIVFHRNSSNITYYAIINNEYASLSDQNFKTGWIPLTQNNSTSNQLFSKIYGNSQSREKYLWALGIDNKISYLKIDILNNALNRTNNNIEILYNSYGDSRGYDMLSIFSENVWAIGKTNGTAHYVTYVTNRINGTIDKIVPFDTTVRGLTDICVTQEYVFGLGTDKKTIYVALNNPNAKIGLVNATADKWTQLVVDPKPIKKLYAHRTCLWMAYDEPSASLGYIPLILNDKDIITQSANKIQQEITINNDLKSQITNLNNVLAETKTTLFNNIKQEFETNIRSEEQASCATRLNSQTANLTSTQEDYTNRLNIKDEAISKCRSDKALIQQESELAKKDLQSKIDKLSTTQPITQPTTIYRCPVTVTDELDNLQNKNKIFMISNAVTFVCCILCVILVFIIKK